jgi:hypothetical protein
MTEENKTGPSTPPSEALQQRPTAEDETPPPNPFDPARFAIKGNPAEAMGVRRLLVQVPVRKPTKQEFVRAHPDPQYQMLAAILEVESENETYVVIPEVAVAIPGETKLVTLTTAINRQGIVFLWPVPLPNPDGRVMAWHVTHRAAAERAKKNWVRMVSNMSAAAYDVFEADAEIAEPDWPDHAFKKLLEIAFGNGRVIDREDHPVLQQLLGHT